MKKYFVYYDMHECFPCIIQTFLLPEDDSLNNSINYLSMSMKMPFVFFFQFAVICHLARFLVTIISF